MYEAVRGVCGYVPCRKFGILPKDDSLANASLLSALQETELVREGSSSCALCAVSTALFSALSGSCARTTEGSHNCQAVYDVRIGWVLPALIDS